MYDYSSFYICTYHPLLPLSTNRNPSFYLQFLCFEMSQCKDPKMKGKKKKKRLPTQGYHKEVEKKKGESHCSPSSSHSKDIRKMKTHQSGVCVCTPSTAKAQLIMLDMTLGRRRRTTEEHNTQHSTALKRENEENENVLTLTDLLLAVLVVVEKVKQQQNNVLCGDLTGNHGYQSIDFQERKKNMK